MSQWRMGRVLALGWAGQSSTLGIHLFFSKISTHLKYDLIFTKRTFLCLNSTWVECLPRDGQDGV